MKKQVLSVLAALSLSLALLVTASLPVNAEDEKLVQMGDQTYATLAEAVLAAEHGTDTTAPETPTTIKLLGNVTGGADIGTTKGNIPPQNILLDLNGHTLTLGSPAIGSTGTETNGLRVLAYSKLEVKNGTIVCPDDQGVKVGLANYGTAVLDGVTFQAGNQTIYTINNRGSLTLKGKTTVETGEAENKIAITNDPYNAYYTDFDASLNIADANVTVGVVQVERYGNKQNSGVPALNISAGTVAEIKEDGNSAIAVDGNITGGTFADLDALKYLGDNAQVTVRLDANVENQSRLTIDNGAKVTVDLNGHDISFAQNSYFLVHGGSLELTGQGEVKESNPYYSPVLLKGNAADSQASSVATIGKDVTLTGWAGLFIDQNSGNNYGIVANVSGTLNSVQDTTGADGHGLYINGSIQVTERMPEINLNGATVTSTGLGMYLAGANKTTIINSTITGPTAIYAKAGEITISGSTVKGTGDYAAPVPNGNGANSTGDAIILDSKAGYSGNMTLQLGAGNRFESANGYAVHEALTDVSESSTVAVEITGGTYIGADDKGAVIFSDAFTAAVEAGTADRSIAGGAFSSDPLSFADEDKTVVSTTAGGDTTYYVGSDANAVLSDEATETVAVLRASGDLSVAAGVVVENKTGEAIQINGQELAANESAETHVLTEVPAKEADCTTAGNIQYWTCEGCDKYFDKDGKEIAKDSVTIQALGHDFQDGKCTRCGAVDPSYTPVTPPTGVTGAVWTVLAIVACGALAGVGIGMKKAHR